MLLAVTAILTALYEASRQVDLSGMSADWLLTQPNSPEAQSKIGAERLWSVPPISGVSGEWRIYEADQPGAYRAVLAEGFDRDDVVIGLLLVVSPDRRSVSLVELQFAKDIILDGPFEAKNREGTYQGILEETLPKLLQLSFPGLEPRVSPQVERGSDLLAEAAQLGVPLRMLEQVDLDDREWAQDLDRGDEGLSIWEIFSELDDAAVVEGLGIARVLSLLGHIDFRHFPKAAATLIGRRLYGDIEALGGDGDALDRRLLELTSPCQDIDGLFEDHPALREAPAARQALLFLLSTISAVRAVRGRVRSSPWVLAAGREALSPPDSISERPAFYLDAEALVQGSPREVFTLEGDGMIPRIALKHGASTHEVSRYVTYVLIERIFNTLYKEAWASQFAEGMRVFELDQDQR